MLTEPQAELLGRIVEVGRKHGQRLFVVGGIVRDALFGAGNLDKDIDIVVEGNAIDFARRCADMLGAKLDTFPKFVTAKISGLAPDRGFREVDFASSRRERYPRPGMLPEVEPSSIEDDLGRRDFTINAIALPLEAVERLPASRSEAVAAVRRDCIDLYGGLRDVDARLIRVLHERSFLDDPTRIYRALRYAERIDGSLEAGTEELLKVAVAQGAIGTVSEFRRYTEIRKIVMEDRPHAGLALLERYGVTADYLPYPREAHGRMVELARSMSQLPSDLSPLRPQLVPRLFIYLGGDRTAADLAGIGLGKKAVQSMLADVELARNSRVSDTDGPIAAALWAVLSHGSEREEAIRLASRLSKGSEA